MPVYPYFRLLPYHLFLTLFLLFLLFLLCFYDIRLCYNTLPIIVGSAMALVCGMPFRFNLLLHFILLSYRLSLSQSDSESEKYGHFSGIELTLSFTSVTVPSSFTSSKRRLKRRSSPCRVSHRFLEYRICFLVMFTLRCSQ